MAPPSPQIGSRIITLSGSGEDEEDKDSVSNGVFDQRVVLIFFSNQAAISIRI
jgi:hypothetical protein